MNLRDGWLALVACGCLAGVGYQLLPPREPEGPTHYPGDAWRDASFQASLAGLNQRLERPIHEAGLSRAPRAEDLAIARRLAQTLAGTVPSLEEIRRFESLPAGQRLEWYTDTLLTDRRHADYFAERWARLTVGTEDGPFIVYRRRRYTQWLASQFQANRPYDELVRALLTSRGLWTDQGAVNYFSVTAKQGDDGNNQPDPVRLAGRTMRAFLGLRIDCAQCHDHPFASWRQTDFEGLTAFFGQTHLGFTGIYDGPGEYVTEEPGSGRKETIAPQVPYGDHWLPQTGSRREQLAIWMTHPENTYFARAVVNRVWALLWGLPLHRPVDNLVDDEGLPEVLKFLAEDFTRHGYDLRRLIRLIVASEAYQRDSAAEFEVTADHESHWAVFPLSRLRPEQIAGSVLQAASVQTHNSESHILLRLIRFGRENDFLQRYADSAEDELDVRVGTIPQRLLLMNGRMVKEVIAAEPLNATGRLQALTSTDRHAIESAFLAVLTRRPTDRELAYFRERFEDASQGRAKHLEDLYWALLNSTEFSWQH